MLRKCQNLAGSDRGEKGCRWEASFDCRTVPPGEYMDLLIEYQSAGQFVHTDENSITIPLNVRAEIAEQTVWLLMPSGKRYTNFRVIRHEQGRPQKVETVRVVTEYLATDHTILAFKLLSLDAGYVYEVNWTYR
jgi:hypothetical protein